ncbi:MAG: DNA polymerase III subunit chi [Marinovum sp.]|nr:DNA polymerase III subunit chi [Marinovum sp.]MBT7906021.1 DNA polymerase III subunit chi [Marinovum sp.]
MGAAYFYHLTRQPLEVALPALLEKASGAGWRIEVRGTSLERMQWLDDKLWLGADDGFLAHGLAGGSEDAQQPILLTTNAEPGFECIMSIDGATLDPQEVSDSQRVCILFNGLDENAMQQARSQWKTLTEAGCAAQYWSEESGRWQKKADSQSAAS